MKTMQNHIGRLAGVLLLTAVPLTAACASSGTRSSAPSASSAPTANGPSTAATASASTASGTPAQIGAGVDNDLAAIDASLQTADSEQSSASSGLVADEGDPSK